MEKSLSGRIALVTGAAQGIGRVMARSLGLAGARIILSDLREDAGEETASQLRGQGIEARFVVADLSQGEQITNMVDRAAQFFGGLDILVNNARPRLSYEAFPASMESWDHAMAVLLKAPALAIAAALPHLERSAAAAVINISSTNAFLISQQPVTYHVTKAAILQLTRHLAVELGPKGIRLNAICPGIVDLDDRPQKLTDDPVNRLVAETVVPLGRAGTAEDIGNLAVFLAGGLAAYITGQAFTIDGGMTLGDQFAFAKRVALAAKA